MVKKIIIADTNWWVSLVIGKFDNSFADLLEQDELEFFSCKELENEIHNTLNKSKLQKFLSSEILNTFWISFHLRTNNINLISTVSICRDPKDNFLLALAKDANADFLITGDNDLLIIQKFENTIICTLSDFITKYLNK